VQRLQLLFATGAVTPSLDSDKLIAAGLALAVAVPLFVFVVLWPRPPRNLLRFADGIVSVSRAPSQAD